MRDAQMFGVSPTKAFARSIPSVCPPETSRDELSLTTTGFCSGMLVTIRGDFSKVALGVLVISCCKFILVGTGQLSLIASKSSVTTASLGLSPTRQVNVCRSISSPDKPPTPDVMLYERFLHVIGEVRARCNIVTCSSL